MKKEKWKIKNKKQKIKNEKWKIVLVEFYYQPI